MQIKKLLTSVAQHCPSDLHVQAGFPPALRIQGVLAPMKTPPLEESQIAQIIQEIAPPPIWERIAAGEDARFTFAEAPQSRYRISVFRYSGRLAAAIRVLPYEIPSVDSLALPEIFKQTAEIRQGLVIVCGRSSSGRTSTVAGLVNAVNIQRTAKILILSRTPEFQHVSQKSMVMEVEIGRDVPNMAHVFDNYAYYNPDVVVTDDLTEWSDISRVLAACDAGALVISTAPAVTAQNCLERLRGFIPESLRSVGLQSMSLNFQAICCQRLCRRKEGAVRVPATEVLRRSPGVIAALEEGHFDQIERALSSGQFGMRTFDQDLDRLVRDKTITEQEAMRVTLNPDSMQMLMRGFGTRTK